MENLKSRPITKRRVFLKPHGFRKLITVDGLALTAFAALTGYFAGFYLGFPQVISYFISTLAIITITAVLVSIKPHEYVTVLNDGVSFQTTRYLIQSYNAMVKFSEIEKIETYVISNGFIGSTYLEIFLKDGGSHKFAKEIFNTRDDYEEFKTLLIKGITN